MSDQTVAEFLRAVRGETETQSRIMNTQQSYNFGCVKIEVEKKKLKLNVENLQISVSFQGDPVVAARTLVQYLKKIAKAEAKRPSLSHKGPIEIRCGKTALTLETDGVCYVHLMSPLFPRVSS